MSKIQTPQRIRLNYRGMSTVYVSSWVATQVRPMCMTINMVMFPYKGQNDALIAQLQQLVLIHPEHFMSGSRTLLKPWKSTTHRSRL